MTAETETVPIVRRFWIVAGAVPGLVVASAVALQLAVLPRLPDSVAVSWGQDGRPDVFAPLWVSPVVTGLLGSGAVALIVMASLPGLRRGDRGPTYRFLGALSVAVAVFVCVLLTWIVVMQAGLAEASAAPGVGMPLLASFLCAPAAGAAAWLGLPRQTPVPTSTNTVEPLALAGSERAAWMRETSLAPVWAITIVGTVTLVWASTIAMWLLGGPDGLVVGLAALGVGLLVLTATAIAFRVRVDHDGLTVTSVLGLPRFRIPLADIRGVEAIEVNAVGDFGGWGLRWAPGRFGVVTRTGEGIQVHRRSGRRFVVTVGDATTGAALLQAIAQPHAPDGSRGRRN